eukprot:7684243-Alexandrium_andersonii.AAC.1
MSASLVGSEMCIRDSRPPRRLTESPDQVGVGVGNMCVKWGTYGGFNAVSYTHLTLPTICSV